MKCIGCGLEFSPIRKDQQYCKRQDCLRKRERERNKRRALTWKPETVGVGKGGSNKVGSEHVQYSTGKGTLNRLRHKIKKEVRYCEYCGADLKNASSKSWCIHHVDRDRTNNMRANLCLLCKRCHQVEHKCWEAFEGATTIPQGSRFQVESKREASHRDDDIV